MTSLAVIPGHGRKRAYQLTDIGNAERLVARFGEDLHYLPAWKKWLVWDGRRWALDETKRVEQLAKAVVRSIWDEARASGTDSDTKKALAQWALKSEADSAIRSLLNRAMAEEGIAITPRALDTDPMALTVANGTLDLRTARLLEHDRAQLSTKLVSIDWEPEARCDRWEAFLDRVMAGNRRLIDYLRRAVGYSLTASTAEQVFFFLHGSGANGKSTFLEILRLLTGDYGTQADFATFLEKKHNDGPRNDIARLFGARVVTSSEVGEGKRLNESLIKALTGTDTIAARFLYAEAFEFRPTFKIWLAANHKPVIRGNDDAIWRRPQLVPFTVQIPPEERDKGLLDALKAELPGILAWAVSGCLDWQKTGLQTPDEVRLATDAYRSESDTLGAFLDEWCALEPGAATRAADLYAAYVRWAEEGGEFKLSQTAFGRRLEERGITAEKRGVGSERSVWRTGVRLTKSLLSIGLPRRKDREDEGGLL